MTRITLLVMLGCFAVTQAAAGDWPYWRGPGMDGISNETGLVDDWSLETGENVLWTSDIGGRATPVIMNGRIFFNSRTPEDVTDPEQKVHAQERVVCLDLVTGEVLWEDRFNVFKTDIPAPRVGWASMCGDPETGYVYMHSVSGLFRCYSSDGELIWEQSQFEDLGKISGYGGRTQTPIIDEDRVIVGYLVANWGDQKGPGPKHAFYAMDKRTGEIQWVSQPGGTPQDTTYTNPIIRIIDGQRQLICGNADGGIHAINARTGEPIWEFKLSKRGLNASPTVSGTKVYISHGEDNIDNTKFGRVQCIEAAGASGDVTLTHSVWRHDNLKAGYTGLLAKDGIVYVVADIGNMYAFDEESGELLWEHDLGTVGKGSPVWADGKIYVMEVNGNVLILKPTREGCETLSHVEIPSGIGPGVDEIYASPAISDGKVVLVTRDRTICLFDEAKKLDATAAFEMAEEGAADEEVALIQLRPYETILRSGESVEYEIHAFDSHGRFIKKMPAELDSMEGLGDSAADGATLTTDADGSSQLAGTVTAKMGEMTATARVRVFPPLPWEFDFAGMTAPKVPPAWVRAHVKLKGEELEDGNVAMRAGPGPGRPSHAVFLGPSDMNGYTVQCDVMLKEQRRRISSVGITVNRYDLILKGNNGKLSLQSWQPHLRMAKEARYRSDPDTWYTMKLTVEIDDDGAHVKGKVWERGEEEPAEWTIEADDPHPNMNGSPGLYFYALADCYFDNVIVSKN